MDELPGAIPALLIVASIITAGLMLYGWWQGRRWRSRAVMCPFCHEVNEVLVHTDAFYCGGCQRIVTRQFYDRTDLFATEADRKPATSGRNESSTH